MNDTMNPDATRNILIAAIAQQKKVDKLEEQIKKAREDMRAAFAGMDSVLVFDKPVAIKVGKELWEAVKPMNPKCAVDRLILRPMQVM